MIALVVGPKITFADWFAATVYDESIAVPNATFFASVLANDAPCTEKIIVLLLALDVTGRNTGVARTVLPL